MQVKSNASLQGSSLSDVKEILSLIGDSKKAKDQLSKIEEDISLFKEQYDSFRKIKEETELVVSYSVELSKNVAEAENKLKEEKSVFEKAKLIFEEKEKELVLFSKKLDIEKNEFLKLKLEKESELNLAIQDSFKSKEKSDKISEDANKLMLDYSEKLEKLKAMVG